jgi:hypothetical protein
MGILSKNDISSRIIFKITNELPSDQKIAVMHDLLRVPAT